MTSFIDLSKIYSSPCNNTSLVQYQFDAKGSLQGQHNFVTDFCSMHLQSKGDSTNLNCTEAAPGKGLCFPKRALEQGLLEEGSLGRQTLCRLAVSESRHAWLRHNSSFQEKNLVSACWWQCYGLRLTHCRRNWEAVSH